MKKLAALFCLMFALSPLAMAQSKGDEKKSAQATEKAAAKSDTAKKEPSEAQKAQQERMADCNKRAGDRKGDERKGFMSSCLKGEDPDASPKQKAQQQKMKDCNAEAGKKNMKGDDRKKFMSDCLSAK
jgi:hypothetical protein